MMEFASEEMKLCWHTTFNYYNYEKAVCREGWGTKLYALIPKHMHESMSDYILFGRLDDEFLKAILEGDLFGAYRFGDNTNVKCIHEYIIFLFNYAPCDCYKSSEYVKQWREAGGLNGIRLKSAAQQS